MTTNDTFNTVWDAIENDPIRRQNLKLRSKLMIVINEYITQHNLTQSALAKQLQISQPRVSALLKGELESFRLDSLVDMVHRLGFEVKMDIAA